MDVIDRVNKMKPCSNAPLDRDCDFCKENKAVVDGPTRYGPWAYMCVACIDKEAAGTWDKVGFKIITGVDTSENIKGGSDD